MKSCRTSIVIILVDTAKTKTFCVKCCVLCSVENLEKVVSIGISLLAYR